jgi:hypothetical protein
MTATYCFGESAAPFHRALLGPGAVRQHGAMRKPTKSHESPGSLPLHDYDAALRNAVSWLGDKYLLAAPAPRREAQRDSWFNAPRSWIGATRTPVRTAIRTRH